MLLIRRVIPLIPRHANAAASRVYLAALILLANLQGAAQPSSQPPVAVKMWAVRATAENRATPHFDRSVEEIRDAVSDLPYDTYREVETAWGSAPYNAETRMRINDQYVLVLKPMGLESGRIRLEVVVEMKKGDGSSVKALDTRLLVTPKNKVKLRGLKLQDGAELVIVLMADS